MVSSCLKLGKLRLREIDRQSARDQAGMSSAVAYALP